MQAREGSAREEDGPDGVPSCGVYIWRVEAGRGKRRTGVFLRGVDGWFEFVLRFSLIFLFSNFMGHFCGQTVLSLLVTGTLSEYASTEQSSEAKWLTRWAIRTSAQCQPKFCGCRLVSVYAS